MPKSRFEINFSKIKRRLLKHVWLVRGALILLLFFLGFLLVLLFRGLLKQTNVSLYFGFAKDFVFAPMEKVQSSQGKTNILILGEGGKNHTAPDLTDTIIFASIDEKDKRVDMVSLPRDIWIPSLRAKINSAYYWGEKKSEGGGGILAKSVVEEIVGQPVHYYVLVDFEGFIDIVDVVGGINVDVERSFTDEKYPIEGKEDDECGGDPEYGCRYETVHFEKGLQKMDGATALKFVRSRNAEGDEGTDFARAARQQKVLQAIKDKMFSKDVYLSYEKLLKIKEVVYKNTKTDINADAAAVIARSVFDSRNNVTQHVIPEDYLYNPPYIPKYDNLYVFVPSSDDWSQVQGWVRCILERSTCN